jgi:hypothetical protein
MPPAYDTQKRGSLSSRTGLLEKHLEQAETKTQGDAEMRVPSSPRGASSARGPILFSRYGFRGGDQHQNGPGAIVSTAVCGMDADESKARVAPNAHGPSETSATADSSVQAPAVRHAEAKQAASISGQKTPKKLQAAEDNQASEHVGEEAPTSPLRSTQGRRALPAGELITPRLTSTA